MAKRTAPKEPARFTIYRGFDASGVSGTGRVLNGVVFPDGVTVVRWCSNQKVKNRAVHSTAVYDSFEDFKRIHVDSHLENKTVIAWFDEELT